MVMRICRGRNYLAGQGASVRSSVSLTLYATREVVDDGAGTG